MAQGWAIPMVMSGLPPEQSGPGSPNPGGYSPADFVLGDFVWVPACPEWGIGQVQSVIMDRVTVNFDHAGKQTINTNAATLMPAPEDGILPSGDDASADASADASDGTGDDAAS